MQTCWGSVVQKMARQKVLQIMCCQMFLGWKMECPQRHGALFSSL